MAIILIVALLLPSAVKFSHALTHHDHIFCKSEADLHFHKKNLDCDFYKFKLSKEFTFVSHNFDLEITQSISQRDFIFSEFHSLLHFQYFLLRAPPTIDLT